MRDSLRTIVEEPEEATVKRARPRFTIKRLAKLSGIPHVQKLKVDEEALVDIMVGIQLNVEEERRLQADKVILYDPHYISGLVELPSPVPSVAEIPVPRWPLVSPKGRKKRHLHKLEKVDEEHESVLEKDEIDYIVSTQLLFDAKEMAGSQISPRQLNMEKSLQSSETASVLPLNISRRWTDIADKFLTVPYSAKSLPDLAEDATNSDRSESSASHSSGEQSLSIVERRRAMSESSVYSHLTQKTNPSLHLYSPWIEELDASFGLRSKGLTDGMVGYHGLIEEEHVYVRSGDWRHTPGITRNLRLASQKGSLGKYRTTHLTSTSL